MSLTDTLKIIVTICYLSLLLFMCGCKTAIITSINSFPSFHDEHFPGYQNVHIESEQDVFEIGETARSFVDAKLHLIKDPVMQIKALADGIFAHSDLNMLYKNDANTVADETYRNGDANCLSLTIMTYAMAKYAGLGVQFQQVFIPELWVRRSGHNLLNRHINLLLFQKKDINIILFDNQTFQLDFDRRSQSLHMPAQIISKHRVLAMFYNNKGAEALIKNEYTRAYAYFRKALITDSMLIEGWTNLGVLYSRSDRIDYSEEAYQRALSINSNDATTLENLAHIYSRTDRAEESNRILVSIKRQRKDNPFYHFMLGEVEYEKQNWQLAIKFYKKAIRLNKKYHQFYFALAKTYYKQGNYRDSEKYLKRAKHYTPDEAQQLLYQGKLEQLHNL